MFETPGLGELVLVVVILCAAFYSLRHLMIKFAK